MLLASNHLAWTRKRSDKVPLPGLPVAAPIPYVLEALRVSENSTFLIDLSGLAHKGGGQGRSEIFFEAVG